MKNIRDQHSNWLNIRNSLFTISFRTGLIAFLVMGLGFLFYVGNQDTWAREALRYKELVFWSANGKSYNDTEVNNIELTKDLTWSIYVGQYFLSEYKRGVPPEKVIAEYRSVLEKMKKLAQDSTRTAFLNALNQRGVPAPILSMARDWRWQKMADSKEDIEILTSILKGEKQAPVLEYQNLSFPWKTFLWWWLLSSQFLSYLFCMIYCADDTSISLSQALSFNQLHTYFVLVLFSPGACPLLVINPVAVRSSDWVFTQRTSIQVRRRKETSHIAKVVPELSSYSDQNLAEKLRKRLSQREV